MIDTEQLKQAIDLREIAGAHSELQKLTAKESAGACPKCGGTDRFHAQAEWYFCRQCHEKRGDVIELVQWLGLAGSFQDAVAWLDRWRGGAGDLLGEVARRKPEPKRAARRWQDAEWQREARELVSQAAQRLASDAGAPGRQYLAERGFERYAWQDWDLGLADVWHPIRKRKMPAITMPYMSRKVIKAVQYRFIAGDLDKSERFSQLAGGERTLFGGHVIAGRGDLLAITEGELNCVSIWQAAGDLFDPVSIGAQDNVKISAPYAAKLAERYAIVLVWADAPSVAHELSEAIGRRCVLMQSPVIDGAKLDANEVLKRGFLRDLVLSKVLDHHLAYLGRSAGSGLEFAKPEHEAHAAWQRFEALEAVWLASENSNSEYR